MLKTHPAKLAMRNRALATVIATTGPTTLEATTTGYKRATGSFLADNFMVGQELVPAGFSANTIDSIVAVTAGEIWTDGSRTAQGPGSNRSLTVGIPAMRAWDLIGFEPVPGRQYVSEEWIGLPGRVRTMPETIGLVEETGAYVLKWHGIVGRGSDYLEVAMDVLKARFTPGTIFSVDGADFSTHLGRHADVNGPIVDADGRAVMILTVPWEASSWNEVAA